MSIGCDALTHVGNRYFFDQRLHAGLAELTCGSIDCLKLLFLDLDRFKAVNDTLGHAIGDTLLGKVAERMRSVLPAGGALSRLGGDEFGMIVADATTDATAALAAKLIDLVERPYLIDGHVIHIGVSIGIGCAPGDTVTASQLLKYADLALYHSKAQGRGTFHFFAAEMETRAQERRQMELDLRRALALRQFEIHYQPQIDVEANRILALEGLLHWRHPSRGLLPAEEFFAIAEEIGISMAIGEWMLRSVCREAVRWPGEVKAAVNISAVTFEADKFAASVEAALTAAGLDGARLEIEVTEDILLRDGPTVLQTLERLRRLKVRVAMDSFGTGFASLSQLVNFPFDKIKIDASLTGVRSRDVKSRAIVQAISALGLTLGITTLAEGVESQGHLAAVRADGCQSLQGFYYGTALRVADLPEMFAFPHQLHPALPYEANHE